MLTAAVFHGIYQATEVLTFSMQGETGERFRKLCQQAAVEQDSEKLLKLIEDINTLLEEKQLRLHNAETIELPNVGSGDHAV